MKYDCTGCKKQITGTKNSRYRSHSDGNGDPCIMSSELIPPHALAQPVGADDSPDVPREGIDYAICPQCGRMAELTRLGYFKPHATTLMGGEQCEVSGVRYKHARRTEDVVLPGDERKPMSATRPAVSAQKEVIQGLAAKVREEATSTAPTSASAAAASSPPALPLGSGAAAPDAPAGAPTASEGSSPESTPTSEPSTGPAPDTSSDAPAEPADAGPWPFAPAVGGPFLQPFSPFFQPGPVPVTVKTVEAMNERGREIATRLREIFYSYVNRDSAGNRSAQTTLGPSEIGTPCDRRIAMKLMNVPAVNPQESWAPFVGTAVHASLAEMFEWANGANSGRFAVEMPLTFGSATVPRGTGDLLDRVLFMFLDHKLMGKYSLKKLIEQGPSETYRVQLHTYGYGAELAGEKVREIALVGWPREESSLSNLYVHVEPYDRQVALDAIARVERLNREVQGRMATEGGNAMTVARQFLTGDDCRWCPFHNKADKGFTRGCPGK